MTTIISRMNLQLGPGLGRDRSSLLDSVERGERQGWARIVRRLIHSQACWWMLALGSWPSTRLGRQPQHLPTASPCGLGFLTTRWPWGKDKHLEREKVRWKPYGLYVLGLEVVQSHFCHILFIKAVTKFLQVSRGDRPNS